MLRITQFEQARCGDIGFKVGDDPFGRAIENLSPDIGAGAVAPSHVFIVGPNAKILEAWFKAREQYLEKYRHYWECGRIRLYRPNTGDKAKLDAYNWTVKRYVGTWYGILQILGHLLVIFKLVKINPWKRGVVCHELGTYYLRRLCQEQMLYEGRSNLWWATTYQPEESEPVVLEKLCIEN